MLPVGFKEFEVGYIFLLLFFFILSLSIGTRSILAKIWGGGEGGGEGLKPPDPLRFLRACYGC